MFRCPACGTVTERWGERHPCVDGVPAGHDPLSWPGVQPGAESPDATLETLGLEIVRDPRIPPGTLFIAPAGAPRPQEWADGRIVGDGQWEPIGQVVPGSMTFATAPEFDAGGVLTGVSIVAEERISLVVERPDPRAVRVLMGRSLAQRWNARCGHDRLLPAWLTVGVADGRRAVGAFPSGGRVLKLWRVRP